MIIAQNISFKYDKIDVIKDLSIDILPNKIIFVIGPNGSGKSTFLQLLSGLITPQKGEILINNCNVCDLTDEKLAQIRSWTPAIVQSNTQFLVKEIVELGLNSFSKNLFCNETTNFQISRFKKNKMIVKCLKKMDIWDKRNHMHSMLSDGEKQRVQLARSLLQLSVVHNKRKIWVLDEPTNSLDFKHKFQIMTLLKQFSREGNCVIIASHDFNLVKKFADEIILLEKGRLIGQENSLSNLPIKTVFEVEPDSL